MASFRLATKLCTSNPRFLDCRTAVATQVRISVRYTTMAKFSVSSVDGKVRVGMIQSNQLETQTPTALLYSKKGGVLNLTPDMLDRLPRETNAVQVDALHYIAFPDPSVIREHGGGLHGFAAFTKHILIVTNRDPLGFEYTAKGTNDNAVAVAVQSGTYKLTPEFYMEIMSALKPDILVALGDEIYADARLNRVAKSVDRSLLWLDRCVSLCEGGGLQGRLWATVQGGDSMQERQRSARESAARPVSGFWLSGFGSGEDVAVRGALLQAAIQELPKDAPRGIMGLGSPEEVLEGISEGVDLFDGSYPVMATLEGKAVVFGIQAPSEGSPTEKDGNGGRDSGADDAKINLWAKQYRADSRPLVEGCSCFTCKSYTRSYIHHLLDSHEMLAGVLLEMHNTHHYSRFFTAIRTAIAEGRFEEYKAMFLQQKKQLQKIL